MTTSLAYACMCASISPGISVRRATSSTRALGAAIGLSETSRIRAPSTSTLLPSGQSGVWPSKIRAFLNSTWVMGVIWCSCSSRRAMPIYHTLHESRGPGGVSVKHYSILEYARFRWFKAALALCALGAAGHLWHEPPLKPYGGTWLGYVLGTIGAVLIVWLMWYGVRKRRYLSTVGTVQGWVSAHIYLGTALVVVATLHTGFELGWNVHTLAYVLMLLVVASGFYGVFVYMQAPRAMVGN